MKEQRNALSVYIRKANDEKIAENIIKSSIFKNAKSIFCYCSFDSEISTINIINMHYKTIKLYVCLKPLVMV